MFIGGGEDKEGLFCEGDRSLVVIGNVLVVVLVFAEEEYFCFVRFFKNVDFLCHIFDVLHNKIY